LVDKEDEMEDEEPIRGEVVVAVVIVCDDLLDATFMAVGTLVDLAGGEVGGEDAEEVGRDDAVGEGAGEEVVQDNGEEVVSGVFGDVLVGAFTVVETVGIRFTIVGFTFSEPVLPATVFEDVLGLLVVDIFVTPARVDPPGLVVVAKLLGIVCTAAFVDEAIPLVCGFLVLLPLGPDVVCARVPVAGLVVVGTDEDEEVAMLVGFVLPERPVSATFPALVVVSAGVLSASPTVVRSAQRPMSKPNSSVVALTWPALVQPVPGPIPATASSPSSSRTFSSSSSSLGPLPAASPSNTAVHPPSVSAVRP